jgi:hypothetical protein
VTARAAGRLDLTTAAGVSTLMLWLCVGMIAFALLVAFTQPSEAGGGGAQVPTVYDEGYDGTWRTSDGATVIEGALP